MLKDDLYLRTNQLEHDLNGTRIAAESALRAKTGVTECCQQFKLKPFLTEDEWKATREFEGVLRETSRLATVSQMRIS